MIPKPKQTSSKPSFRWPWPKKRKGHRTVDQHPQDLEDEVPTEQIESEESNAGRIQSTPTEYVQAASQVVVASNPVMASVSEERRATEVTSRGASSSVGGLRITQTTMSNAEAVSSFLPNASGCVFHGLQINAHQHELASNSNDPSGALPVTVPISLSLTAKYKCYLWFLRMGAITAEYGPKCPPRL
jgi:hypothetical protein